MINENPKITIKNKAEIEKMKKAGHIAALVLDRIKKEIKPGMTTLQIERKAEKIILENKAECSFKGFGGYPAATCISINEEVVHGIPSNRTVKVGDLVGIDIGVYFLGYHADTAITIGIGQVSKEKQKLLDVTLDSLKKGIAMVKPGIHLGDVQAVIQNTIESAGFGVIRDLSGHGIGTELQEPPSIPNFGQKGTGLIMQEGMTIALEPMVSSGDFSVRVKPDGWTVITADGSPSAHFEHTIAVTSTGAEILTKL